jgi:hypothetical protein
VNSRIATFNGTTGKLIQDSGYGAQDATTAQKGFTQLSNLYTGTSQTLAATEYALSQGLATKQNAHAIGNLTPASTKVTVTGGTGAVIGAGATVDVVEANLTISNMAGVLGLAHGGTGQATAGAAINALLPVQTGNNGKVLGTDGTNPSWVVQGGGGSIQSKVRCRNTTIQSIPNSTPTKIQFQTKDYDGLTEFDNTTNFRFTAQASGYYQVAAAASLESSSGTGILQAMIYKNGSKYSTGFCTKTGSRPSGAAVSDIVYLAATEYIEIYVSQFTGGARNTSQVAGEQSYFAIHRLS